MVGAGAPVAATAATDTPQIQIDPNASVVPFSHVVVGLKVRCYGGILSPGTGQVGVELRQTRPESPFVTAGTGGNLVVCDGKMHTVAVTVPGNFDAGKAVAVVGIDTSLETETKEINLKVR
jgi:hypothetical protein